MLRIAPFRGVLYNQKKIRDLAKVIAPPYDVISTAEQERLFRSVRKVEDPAPERIVDRKGFWSRVKEALGG